MTRLRCCLLLVATLWLGCGSTEPLSIQTHPTEAVSFVVVSDSLEGDPAILAMVAPYSEEMAAQISEVVGRADEEIREGRPEGPLGTFAANAMLHVVQRMTNRPVELALTNNGGLRVPLGPGDITVGKMFELMPFDNMMIVLDLTADQVRALAADLARGGGDPIAGFSFTITANDEVADLRIRGKPVDNARTYRLVTSDYLANGGGPYEVLWEVTEREEVAYLLRDAFTDYLREIGFIENMTEGLIRRAP